LLAASSPVVELFPNTKNIHVPPAAAATQDQKQITSANNTGGALICKERNQCVNFRVWISFFVNSGSVHEKPVLWSGV